MESGHKRRAGMATREQRRTPGEVDGAGWRSERGLAGALASWGRGATPDSCIRATLAFSVLPHPTACCPSTTGSARLGPPAATGRHIVTGCQADRCIRRQRCVFLVDASECATRHRGAATHTTHCRKHPRRPGDNALSP